jgi:PAS domain S-box-containing protein
MDLFSLNKSKPLSKIDYLKHARLYWIAIVIFLIGLALSLIFFFVYRSWETKRNTIEFNRLADIRIFLVEDMLKSTVMQVDYIKHFFISASINRSSFHSFVRPIFDIQNNIEFFGWIETDRLNQSNLDESTPQILFARLKTSPLQIEKGYFVNYLELKDPDEPLYVDSASYPAYLHFLQSSLEGTTTTLSEDIVFLQSGEKKGFFIFSPLFYKDPELIPQTEFFSNLRGIIICLANFEDLITTVHNKIEPVGIHIAIYDETGQSTLLYSSSSSDPLNQQAIPSNADWSREYVFNLANRTWKIIASSTSEFDQQKAVFIPWLILLGGLLMSGLASTYFLILVNRRILIEQEVWNRTEELATINEALHLEVRERQRIESDFTRNQRYLQKRHEALEYLTKFTTSELRKGIQEVILKTATVMQVDRVSVWLYETFEKLDRLICASLYTLSTNSFSENLELKSINFPHYFRFLTQHSHLIIPSNEDPEINKELAVYLSTFHIVAKLDIPILFEGKLLGVLFCEETRYPKQWLLEDRHFGQTIADIISLMIEQSERREAEKALQESEERLRFITQKAADAIISITDKGEIVSWNYGAEQMFGYSEVEILGKPLNLIIPQQELIQDQVTTRAIEVKGKNKEDKLFPVEMSHSRWKSGQSYFDTIIIRDITERKEYEKRLISAMKEARAASAAKSEFLATISHELRTPLNAIIGFTQCLLMEMDGPINDNQKTSLKKVEKSAFHLLSLINDILDLAKVEANKMELEISTADIVEVLTSCIEEMQPLAKQKNLPIKVNINKSHFYLEVDRLRIRQVMLNLLSNAIKFTEKGYIEVQLTTEEHGAEIRVKDTGIGLTSEEMQKVFKPFSQADSSITRKYGGTGLGLAISKKIVDLHGGTIQAESEKGVGSTFIVFLPRTQ